MNRCRRAAARVSAVLLPALSLAVVVPGTAHAATRTYAVHDGTAEAGFRFDPEDGWDWLSVGFNYPEGTVASASSATLRIYAQAEGCGSGTTGTQAVYTNSNALVTEFDPCAVFPTTGFGWASFSIPVSVFPSGSPSWAVKLHPVDRPGERHTLFAFDTDTEAGGTYAYWSDPTTETYVDQPGEAMWELDLEGNTPALAVSPKSLAYGLVDPGTTSAARRVTVTSTGTADVASITSVTITGPQAGDFAAASDTCTGNPLAYGASCTVDVTFTPGAIGDRTATLTVTMAAGSKTVALSGAGRSLPPVSAFTTADGVTVWPGDPVTGTVTDDIGMGYEFVTFQPDLPALAAVGVRATLTCAPAMSCTWSVPTPLLAPGRYTVTATGTDVQGIVESPGPHIAVHVVI